MNNCQDPFNASPLNIWDYKQNKPSLIAKDMLDKFNIPEVLTLRILMARGVFKWFTVRRNLIKQKNTWKQKIKEDLKSLSEAKKKKDWARAQYLRGKLKALSDCRKDVRKMCHSQRWTAPDFDQKALKRLNEHLNIRSDYMAL